MEGHWARWQKEGFGQEAVQTLGMRNGTHDLQQAGTTALFYWWNRDKTPTVAVEQELKLLNCGTVEINYIVET